MGSESEEKSNGQKQRFRVILCFLAAPLILLGGTLFLTFYLNLDRRNYMDERNTISITRTRTAKTESPGTQQQQQPSLPLPTKVDGSTKLENCTISHPPNHNPASSVSWTTKPLWFPSYPCSLEEFVHKEIIKQMTGLSAGGKSFYASSKRTGLRQCFGSKTETATCTNIHPIIKMGNGGPASKSQAKKFFKKFIFAIRNPRTVIPAFHNEKAIKYHGLKKEQQVPIKNWEKDRNEYLSDMMETYKNMLRTWKSVTHDQHNNTETDTTDAPYQVGMYLVYEHLYDAQKGPLVLQRLARILREAGFVTTASDEDIPCIWHKVIGMSKRFEQYEKYQYEYTDYHPGYTSAQTDLLTSELSGMMAAYSEDTELVLILKEYRDDIIQDHSTV